MNIETRSAGGQGDHVQRRRGGKVVTGLVVITVGVMLLLDRTGQYDFHLSGRLWPFLLILIGAARLAEGAWDRTRGWVTALWLIYVGGWGLVNEWHLFGFDYDTSWPLLVIGVGLLIVGRSLQGPRVRPNRREH